MIDCDNYLNDVVYIRAFGNLKERYMFNDVALKIKKKNQILFNFESECLQELILEFQTLDRIGAILWAFEEVEIIIDQLQPKYPEYNEITEVLKLASLWAHGEIKMPQAKKGILSCHALAKKMDDPIDIALVHAIGQGCSTVHVKNHAMGIVFYALTAIVIEQHYDAYTSAVLGQIDAYKRHMVYWKENVALKSVTEKWASFLRR